MAKQIRGHEPVDDESQVGISRFSSLEESGDFGGQESNQILPTAAKKKLNVMLPSRRSARSSPSLQNTFSGRLRSPPQTFGQFMDLQSPAYELSEIAQEQRPERLELGPSIQMTNALSEKPYSKNRSGWKSIKPHLLSSHLVAQKRSSFESDLQISPSDEMISTVKYQAPNESGLPLGSVENLPRRLRQDHTTGFDFPQKSSESKDRDLIASSKSPDVLANEKICSYLDATNEFSDIPMIEGTLRINDTKAASQSNTALLKWNDIVSKVEVRLFNIQTLRRGFSDVSVIPEVKSSFFDIRKFGDLYPRRIISVSGMGSASNSATGQASINSERSFCLIFSSDQSCLEALEMITSLTLTSWIDAQDLSKKYSKLKNKDSNNNDQQIHGKSRTVHRLDGAQEDVLAHRSEVTISRNRRTTTISTEPQDLNISQGIHADSARRHQLGITDVLQSKSASDSQKPVLESNENGLIWLFRFVKNFYQRIMTNPKKVIFSISNSHFWICVVLGCSVYSLLARDIWTIANGPTSGDPLLYGLLVVCFVVFCLQVVANFVVDRSHYQFGYKFWVDILVILTTIFDVFYSGKIAYDLGCASVGLRANQCLVYFAKAQQFARIHSQVENDEDLVRSMVELQNSRIAADRFLQQTYPMGCTEQNLPYLEVLEVLEQKHMTLSQKIIKIFNQRVTITVLVLIFIFQFGKVFVAVSDYPTVFQLSSVLMLTDLTPNRDINEMPAAMIMGNTLDLYPNTLSLCIEGICPIGINDPEPSNWRSGNLKVAQLGDSKNYLWLVTDIRSDITLSIFNIVSLFGIPVLILWANVAFNRDIDRLVKNPLQTLTERINEFAANPSTKIDALMKENDARKTKEETYYIQKQLCHLLKALQSSCGPVGNFFLTENLTKNDFSMAIQGKKVRIVSASVDIRNFTELSECLELDIYLYVNKIAGHLHSFVASSAGCCFRNSGDQFSCAWRCSDKTEDVKALAERQAKEGESKSKKEGKTTNAFDKALSAMIKTLNSCNFDQELVERALYCERLTNQMPNFQLKLCFGFHYGSAIEGIIGSNYRFETCFASMNSDFQATLQRGCTYYKVNSLFSDKFVQSLSSLTRNSFRLLDFVQVPGLREPLGIYTFDWVPRDPLQYAHVKSIKQFFDLNAPKYNMDDLAEYRKAIDAYVEGNWTGAVEQFKALLEGKFINDGPCQKMIEFMQMFGCEPPDDWKGCSELQMLEGIKDIRDIYKLPY